MTSRILLSRMMRLDEAHAGAFLRWVLHYRQNGPVKMAALRKVSPSLSALVDIAPDLFVIDDDGAYHPKPVWDEMERRGEPRTRRELYDERFLQWWKGYGFPIDKELTARRWHRLTEQERHAAEEHSPAYVQATHTDGTFPSRRHPSVYLSKKTWESPIPKGREEGQANTGRRIFDEAARHFQS